MLPEAVRMLYVLKHALGKRVYVHCTAGINRATLTVVGYLTFVQVTCGAVSKHSPLHCSVMCAPRKPGHNFIPCHEPYLVNPQKERNSRQLRQLGHVMQSPASAALALGIHLTLSCCQGSVFMVLSNLRFVCFEGGC